MHVLSEGRKGGGRILIQAESVYSAIKCRGQKTGNPNFQACPLLIHKRGKVFNDLERRNSSLSIRFVSLKVDAKGFTPNKISVWKF